MPEHVLTPGRAAELVIPTDRGHQMCAVVEAGVRDFPWVRRGVGVLDTNAGGIGCPVSGVPGGVAVPHELPDPPGGFYLVVGGGGPGLPHVPAPFDGEVAGVVVDDHLVDSVAGASFGGA